MGIDEYDWKNIDSIKCISKNEVIDKISALHKLDYHFEIVLNKEYHLDKTYYAIIYIVKTDMYDGEVECIYK